MAKNFRKGDRVEWNTPQGETEGTVVRKVTSDTRIKGHVVRASDDDPQFLVESERSVAQAAHRPEALKKR